MHKRLGGLGEMINLQWQYCMKELEEDMPILMLKHTLLIRKYVGEHYYLKTVCFQQKMSMFNVVVCVVIYVVLNASVINKIN